MNNHDYNPADEPAKNGFNFTPPRILRDIPIEDRKAACQRLQDLKDATREALNPSEQFED